MQLLKTGAFVRAARAARVAIANPLRARPSSATLQPSRWASSQAQAQAVPHKQPFPEKSVNLSQEVEPAKTAAASTEPGGQSPFEKKLQEPGQENKIIQENGRSGAKILGAPYIFDETSNLSSSILSLVGRNLYEHPDHPISITRKLIESCFQQTPLKSFAINNPVATVRDNFDALGFPDDHPGRSRTDTYYVNSTHLLRTHTSAHEREAFTWLANNPSTKGYTICADVYRRDSIDRSHFPVFHQMEGARVWAPQENRAAVIEHDCKSLPQTSLQVEDQATDFSTDVNPYQPEHNRDEVHLAARHLKLSLEQVIQRIFEASQASLPSAVRTSAPMQARWIEAYFPFTSPSFELEVDWNGEWLELLGCGVTTQGILERAGLNNHIGWAWGVGIERFAMLLFGIPDIRLFWSTDPRFLKQFSRGKVTKFEPFSRYPACYKDIAFWINATPSASSPLLATTSSTSTSGVAAAAGGDSTKASPAETQPAAFHENDIMEVVRDVAGSLVEDVKLVDEFVHPTSGRKSLCYRINYRSLERTLTNEEVNSLHDEVARRLKGLFGVELR